MPQVIFSTSPSCALDPFLTTVTEWQNQSWAGPWTGLCRKPPSCRRGEERLREESLQPIDITEARQLLVPVDEIPRLTRGEEGLGL
ncbi:unnamed protein product [Danaus chrysippus]|uniref:(African queen) hypothetical protein n=1 Tax=Danaus chrysippus TaxID=151541 RepID=A0A8J2QMS9_9NEOP|nr:unnamed protein product [Danaus chrysippus]